MSIFRTAKNIKLGVLRRSGEYTDGSSPYEEVVMRYMNQVYRSVIAGASEFDVDVGEPYVWARASTPKSLVLEPALETGTVSVTNGSTSASFSSAPAASQTGNLLKTSDESDYYRIAAHTGGATAFTLDANFVGTTNATASYKVLTLEYEIGTDVLRLVEPFRLYRNQDYVSNESGQIMGLHINALRRQHPLTNLKFGPPTAYAVTYDSDGTMKVTFNKSVSEQTKVDIDYIPEPADLIDSDDSVPIIPLEHRQIIEYGATYFLLLDKNDSKAQQYFQLTQQGLMSLVEAEKRQNTNIDLNKGQMHPRLDEITSRDQLVRSESGFIIG